MPCNKSLADEASDFVPIASSVSQYRPTVEHHFGGWNTFSLLTDKSHKYTLPGMVFEAEEGASANFIP
jgi:hypothetical protein